MRRSSFLAAATVILASGCGADFSTRYDRIESDRVRNLAFVYDNHGAAEGAPGDTVWCTVYWAGEQVKSVDLSVATAPITDRLGVGDTIGDTIPLDRYLVPGSLVEHFGGETDSLRFAFKVPSDIISAKFTDDATIGSLLAVEIADSVPVWLREVRPARILGLIERFSDPGAPAMGLDAFMDSLSGGVEGVGTAVLSSLPLLLQTLTVNMKLFATVNSHYRMESTFTVRYNSRLRKIDASIPVNRNPRVGRVNCYRVKGDMVVFDPEENRDAIDTVFRIFPRTDTVLIDKGFRYFLVADSLIGSPDYGVSLTDPMNRYPENYSYEWFFRNGPGAVMHIDSLLTLNNGFGNESVELVPSVDTRLTGFGLWLVTFDGFLGEKLRPVGFEVKCMSGTFAYTDAYLNGRRK